MRIPYRWFASALFAIAAFALPHAVMAQGTVTCPPSAVPPPPVPLTATLSITAPPPNGVFSLTTQIPLVLQIKNTSRNVVCTTEGFSRTEFWRLLYFASSFGTTINAAEHAIHTETRVLHCFSRNGQLIPPPAPDKPPTAISVVPLEVLDSSFGRRYDIPDARTFYDLSRPGRYFMNARIPLSAFLSPTTTPGTTGQPAVFDNCDQFPGVPLVNVGDLDTSPGTTLRQDFTVVSNSVEIFVCCLNFAGFFSPLGTEGPPDNCASKSCLTKGLGTTIPVKFKLPNETVPGTTPAFISAEKDFCGGERREVDLARGSVPTNQFRFDQTNQQYVFPVDTSALSVGTWCLKATIDDGSIHQALVTLK